MISVEFPRSLPNYPLICVNVLLCLQDIGDQFSLFQFILYCLALDLITLKNLCFSMPVKTMLSTVKNLKKLSDESPKKGHCDTDVVRPC